MCIAAFYFVSFFSIHYIELTVDQSSMYELPLVLLFPINRTFYPFEFEGNCTIFS